MLWLRKPTDCAIGGHGVIAKVDGTAVAAGNSKLMCKLGVEHKDCHSAGTIVHLAIEGGYAGHLVKSTARQAIEQLQKAGVEKSVMLTGDAKTVADRVGAELGADEIHSELLPGDMVSEVEKLMSSHTGRGAPAFVGDGINDAPVLSRTDIGIAMGALGSDAAIKAADIVLMYDDPLKIATCIRISHKCISIVYQNTVFTLRVKAVFLALGALGMTNMWGAIFTNVGVTVPAMLNAIRSLYNRSVAPNAAKAQRIGSILRKRKARSSILSM